MRVIIQRVKEANIEINKLKVASINNGLLIYVGITHNDDINDVEYLVNKIYNLRIFSDECGKMNISLSSMVNKSILIISQFTLFASCKKGNRPSFVNASNPLHAKEIYNTFIQKFKDLNVNVETGVFAADMKVFSINDGPVTINIDTKNLE